MAAVHIAWFDRHDPALEPVLGGKNTSLGIMTMAGLPVPPGFAITADGLPPGAQRHRPGRPRSRRWSASWT